MACHGVLDFELGRSCTSLPRCGSFRDRAEVKTRLRAEAESRRVEADAHHSLVIHLLGVGREIKARLRAEAESRRVEADAHYLLTFHFGRKRRQAPEQLKLKYADLLIYHNMLYEKYTRLSRYPWLPRTADPPRPVVPEY